MLNFEKLKYYYNNPFTFKSIIVIAVIFLCLIFVEFDYDMHFRRHCIYTEQMWITFSGAVQKFNLLENEPLEELKGAEFICPKGILFWNDN